MTLLEKYLPVADFREVHSTRVCATPVRAFLAIKSVRSGELPIMHFLLAIRALPAIGRARRAPMFVKERPLLESAVQVGFIALGEVPNRELVIGVIGQPWRLRGGPSPRIGTAGAFAAFDGLGYAKVATNFLLQEVVDGTIVQTETRVHATDPVSRRAFARCWLVIRPWSGLIRREWLAAIKRRAEARLPERPERAQ